MRHLTRLLLLLVMLLALALPCSAAEMKLYTNEQHSFSLEIPAICDYYIPTFPTMPPAVMYASSNSGYNIDVVVFGPLEKADGDDNALRGLGLVLRDHLRQSGSSLLAEKLIILDNGQHALLSSYTCPANGYGGGMNILGTTVQFWTNNRVYRLNYTMTNLDYDKYGDTVRASYQSFRINK